MDILVTTPKSEIETSKKEGDTVEEYGGYWFRTFRYKPKVENGDKIYFVENGQVKGYGIVFEISQIKEGEKCELTERSWGQPNHWVIKYNNWNWIDTPFDFKGFQGIRYIDRLPELKEKLIHLESKEFQNFKKFISE